MSILHSLFYDTAAVVMVWVITYVIALGDHIILIRVEDSMFFIYVYLIPLEPTRHIENWHSFS